MAHRGATITVKRKDKTVNVPAHLLPAYEKRGWKQTSGAPAPVEAKKPKTEKADVDTEK